MPDFKKLGMDRNMVNTSKIVGGGQGNLTTGNISSGELVEVSFTSSDSATATVQGRRTAALPGSISLDGFAEAQWAVSGTTLTVTLNVARTGTLSFWVF